MAITTGFFGTLQLNGTLNDPICYLHLPALPAVGTIIGVVGTPPTYYRVIQSMTIVKPLTEMSLAALLERAEASGEKLDVLSNQCVIFVEPFDPTPGE